MPHLREIGMSDDELGHTFAVVSRLLSIFPMQPPDHLPPRDALWRMVCTRVNPRYVRVCSKCMQACHLPPRDALCRPQAILRE